MPYKATGKRVYALKENDKGKARWVLHRQMKSVEGAKVYAKVLNGGTRYGSKGRHD